MEKARANEIDLLRFLAAIAVVLFHYAFRGHAGGSSDLPYPLLESVARYGRYGVELFFMISGFVILMSASSGNVRTFVISRVVRLYPAFWACCTITFVVLLMFGRHQPGLVQYIANMTMFSGFSIVQKIAPFPHLDGSYWSLVVEMRFYALVVLVLLLGKIHRAELFLCAWLALIVGYELAHVDHLREDLIIDYGSYFIAGAMMYQIWKHGLSMLRLAVIFLSWLVSIYESLAALPKFESVTHTTMDRGVVAALITVFFITMFLVAIRKTGWVGARNWVRLGALTYPLYLIHQTIGYVIFNALYPALNPHLLVWGTIAVMIVVAYVINIHVEQRFSRVLRQQLVSWFALSNPARRPAPANPVLVSDMEEVHETKTI